MAARVSGIIALEQGLPASDLQLRLYTREIGGARTLVGEARTAADGAYELANAAGAGANLEVYAVGADGREVQLSRTAFDAQDEERLDLVAPAGIHPVPSELARLQKDLTPRLSGAFANLRTAVEMGGRADFSALAAATGWDAGAIALASEALEVEARTGIPAEGAYALARAGLPTDAKTLARVSKDSVARALAAAAAAGVIDAAAVDPAAKAFAAFAGKLRLSTPAPGTVSSAQAFLALARIPDADRARFAAVVEDGMTGDVWGRAAAAGVSDAAVAALQLQGKLAALTLNNAELTAFLEPLVGGDVRALIRLGYHAAAKWTETLRQLAGGDAEKLAALTPPAFAGSTEERAAAYAEEMARRVRQIDPYAVTIARVAAGELAGVAQPQAVGAFLANAAARGFQLGKTPLSAFLRESGEAVWAGVDPGARDAVIAQTRTLAALYPLSPSDEALSALLQAGLTSATSIARWSPAALEKQIGRFLPPRPDLGSTRVTAEIYWRAQQQSATVFNVFDGLERLQAPLAAPGSTALDLEAREGRIAAAREKLSGLFPTVETLFGSADYCACDQCQSVLSPAAYLVDLLRFIDPSQEAWESMTASYEDRVGAPYPAGKGKPFDALNRRRPDIKNLALTCENTNTELPYIDVVLEILEQIFVADGAPPEIEAYDVGDTPSADLIAEPQNTLWSAYVGAPGRKGLRDLVYPPALPFDLPLETVREFLAHLELPLWKLREAVAAPKALGLSAPGRVDGWKDVWMERLGLGPADVAALTRMEAWHELLGYASEAEALETDAQGPTKASLRNAKTLARRLDVSYEDLVELLRTRFVNPDIEALVALDRLGIDPGVLDRRLGFGAPLDAEAVARLDADLAALGVTLDELRPLRAPETRKRTLVLRSPSSGCDFSDTWLAFAEEPDDPHAAIVLALRKLEAMARLRRRIGWDIRDIDRALTALTPGAAGLTAAAWPGAIGTALVHLAHVAELQELLGGRVSAEEILTFWTDIPTAGVACLYERLFRSPAALGRDPAFDKRLGAVLTDPAATIEAHADTIRQALGIEAADLGAILAAAGADGRLTIGNLSTLMRHARLAAGLDMPVTDLLALLGLSERKPFTPLRGGPIESLEQDAAWTETIAFVREAQVLARAGVDAAFLERVCRCVGAPEELPRDADPVFVALDALDLSPLPAGDPALAEQRGGLVKTLAAQLSAPAPLIQRLLSGLHVDGKTLEESFSPKAPDASVRKLRKALDVVQSLGLDLRELDHLAAAPGALDLDALPLAPGVPDADARAARKGLGVWLDHAAARNALGPAERVLAVIEAAVPPIDAQGTYEARAGALVDALAALSGAKAQALAPFLAAIGALPPPGGDAFRAPALADAPGVARIVDAFKRASRIKLAPADVVELAGAAIDQAVAQKMRASLRSRYAPSAWRQLAKQIFDVLRQKQRDALLAHITNLRDGDAYVYGETAEKVFESLLIDPGMQSVVLASRIQLAIASVQLFIHRCLRNEEPEVAPEIIDKARWEWMQRYRVWEVNRKFFIWPENWLDPELRDDKTHLFRALESKLLQGDVDDDLVAAAMHDYLRGLELIGRLDILTMYFEPGASADSSSVHVVARTPSAPDKYFYRRMSHGMWTPWEPIDLGIEGRHLVLTKWRGRLHLFWVSFFEETQKNDGASGQLGSPVDGVDTASFEGRPRVKLQLHWAEQVAGAWTSRSSTQGFVDTDFDQTQATTDDQKSAFFVRAVLVEHEPGVADDDLEIQITNGAAGHRFVLFSKLAPPISDRTGASAPATPPFAGVTPAATKWKGTGPLSASFVSTVTQYSTMAGRPQERNGGAHVVLEGGGEFTLLFPSNEQLPIPARRPPAGVGRPFGFVFGLQAASHVVYRDSDGAVHDLFGTRNGWFHQTPSADAQSGDPAGEVEPAESDPHGYGLDGRGLLVLPYAGRTKVHELVWSQLDADPGDAAQMAAGWRCETLYTAPSDAAQPAGRVLGGLFAPDRGVVFRTRDGAIRAVVETAAGFAPKELVPGAPAAASGPCGVAMTKPGASVVTSRHVFYQGVDGHIHELRSVDAAAAAWTHVDISAAVPAAAAPAPGGSPGAYAFVAQGTLHIVYRGADDKIHELWGAPGTWSYNATGAPFTAAKGDPSGYVTESQLAQHIVYRGKGDEVVELWWWGGVWRENVLSATVGDAAPAGGDVAGFSFEDEATQTVVHLAPGGEPRKIAWADYVWTAGAFELKNPFPDPLGPLAAPFFYEAGRRPDTFFVEPYVIETTAHTWTSWVVTTEEYVPDLRAPYKLVPLAPKSAAPIAPSPFSLRKLPDAAARVRDLGAGVMIRTSKGVVETQAATVGAQNAVANPAAPAAPVLDTGGGVALSRLRTTGPSIRSILTRGGQ